MTDEEKKQKLELILKADSHVSITEIESALQIAESLEDVDFRSWYLSRLAQKLAKAEQPNKALTVARSVTGFYDRMDALLIITDEVLKRNETPVVVKLLNEIASAVNETKDNEIWPWQKADTLNRVAKLFKQIGDMRSALETWRKAIDIAQAGQSYDIDSSSLLAEIAKELSLSGQLPWAKDVAESIQSVGKREYALQQISLQNKE